MLDDGTGGDKVAVDGIFSATIPGTTSTCVSFVLYFCFGFSKSVESFNLPKISLIGNASCYLVIQCQQVIFQFIDYG